MRQNPIVPAEEAINLYYQQNRFDKVGENVAKLYPNIVALQSATLQAGDQQKVELLKAKLRPLRRLQVEAFTRSRNEPVEPTAHNVGQGEVGFSNSAPLGTTQTNDCVCLIVRDPVTKKTALAHIDHLTAADSLKNILDRLPTPAPPERLQAKLIGARLLDGGPNDPPNKITNCIENIKKISGFLKDNEVDIISTDFSQPPGNLVVDPKTFDVIEATPNMDYPDAVITLGRQSIAFSNDPLRVAFDLTISQERSPVLVSNKSLATLAAYGNNETAIYDWFKNHQYGLGSPLYTELVFSLKESHEKAVNDISTLLDKKIENWNQYLKVRHPGTSIDEAIIENAKDVIRKHSVHIGEGASDANKPLVEVISKLRIKVEGNMASFDVDKLEQVRFPEQPYDAIAKKALAVAEPLRRSTRENKGQRIK